MKMFSNGLAYQTRRLVCGLSLVGLLASCISGPPGSQAKSSAKEAISIVDETKATARVQPKWQQILIDHLSGPGAEKATGAGLFSYSGWADRGQRFVILSQGSARLFAGGVGSAKVENEAEIPAKMLDAASSIIETFDGLDHFDSGAFDGIQFEYLHAVRDGMTITIKKRVFMNNPDVGEEGKSHQAAVQSFLDLEKSGLKPQ